MTMKKLGFSIAAAVAMGTTAFAAGSLLPSGGVVGKFSNELISNQSVTQDNLVALEYTCGIVNATASEAGFELKLQAPAMITASADAGTFGVYEKVNGTQVAVFDRYDPVAHSIIFKAVAGQSISRGLVYVVGDSNAGTISAGEMTMQVTQGSTQVVGELIVTDNTGVNVIDTATSTIMTGEDQFKMSIDSPFDAQIDAAAAFKQFYTAPNNSDDVTFTIENNKNDFAIQAIASDIRFDVVADQNLTSYAITPVVNLNVNMDQVTFGDYNLTLTSSAPDVDFSNAITATYTTDKTGPMAVTNFTATGVVKFSDGVPTMTYTKTVMDAENAGSWTIYGYNAQIPNVASTATVDVVMKFTNRSSIDSDIFLTLIDQDGTVVTIDSQSGAIPAIPAGQTGTYRASELVALITDPNFNTNDSFSVEVSIPTTPDSVYGFASFKNLQLGQFKDLPIYNTSSMTY